MPDLIESLLERVNLRTRVFHRGKHCGNWKLDLEHSDKVLFHFVSEGSCVVELPEQQRHIKLTRGDLLLIPRPGNHVLRAASQNRVDTGLQACDGEEKVNGESSGLVCAYVEFDPNIRNPLFEALPDYVITRADSHPDRSWIKNLLELLFAEASAETTASQTVIERLTDILFIHVLRSYLANCPADTGILAAYNDPALRVVLELMHHKPQNPWSIADFAVAANLSRSAFIEKFSRTLEVAPMTYLTQQRLEYSYRQLREGECNIIDIALDCGYENESSFSKAFKRMYGITPGQVKNGYERNSSTANKV